MEFQFLIGKVKTHLAVECNFDGQKLKENVYTGRVHPDVAKKLWKRHLSLQNLKNYLNENKQKLEIVDIVDVDGVRVIFQDGWGLVRASNTTPVLVTRFEAKSEESLKNIRTKLMEILNKFL